MSCVPSYVYTLSRFAMWRIDAYSARIPFAPSRRRASRAMLVAMLTLLRFHNFSHHVREALLLQLESGDRFSEHHAIQSVRDGFLVACHRSTRRPPSDSVSRLVKAHQWTLESDRFRKNSIGRQANILKHELTRI